MLTPMPLLEQIDVLRLYLRTLRADCNRASRDSGRHYRKRRVTPFVESLRYRRSRNAWGMLDIAEECLSELRKARALSIAKWFPGDQVLVETMVQDYPPDPRRVVITGVEWSKPDSYHYDVWQLTRAGRFYERGGMNWLYPSNRVRVTRGKDRLPEETQRICENYRSGAQRFLEEVRDRGEIDHIVKVVQERRARRGY